MNGPPCELPLELKQSSERFERWYKNKHSNRNLTWLFSNGSVEVQVLYTQKKYQLVVNVFQAAILCLFNNGDNITCQQIKDTTHMPEENFKAGMMRMCDPKIKLLKKEVNKPVFNPNEKININPAFKSQNIRLSLIPVKTHKKKNTQETAEEAAATKQVIKERTFVIQAHAVKVMKAQKSYRYQNLTTDIIRNITMFKAEPKMIKE